MLSVDPKIRPACELNAELSIDVAIVGAGACGLTAALAACDSGADVLVFEKGSVVSGSTAMSSGFVPAAGTKFQKGLGIDDSPELFAADIQNKSHGLSHPQLVALASQRIGPTLEWLADRHGLDWIVLDDFLYPGHSVHRMHAVPEKTGEALVSRLMVAAENAGASIVYEAGVETLYIDGDNIKGISIRRPDGTSEQIACRSLVLACNGYGDNPKLIASHLPYMKDAPYHGHSGNTGEAVLWGEQLSASLSCLSACQGHGSLAHPHGILITWALMMEGGIQVNRQGKRFSNEHQGYSEQSIDVLAQDGGTAWSVFDERILKLAQSFPDFQQAEAAGAIKSASNIDALAELIRVPASALRSELETIDVLAADKSCDSFGRDFSTKPTLSAPFHAIKVTGALFHTQGGLMIDDQARVLKQDGTPFENLFAGGGAACGVSGTELSGYLSGNGLLTAIAFGQLAGKFSAKISKF